MHYQGEKYAHTVILPDVCKTEQTHEQGKTFMQRFQVKPMY